MSFEAQTILLAEDNEDDVFIFERAYKQIQAANPLQIARDGEEVTDYLSGAGPFADRAKFPIPHLLLLDLKLPLRHGLEILEWLRTQPELAKMKVVVLTSSAEPRDLVRAKELGARHYFVKPPKSQTLAALLKMFRAEWDGGAGQETIEGDLFLKEDRP